MMMPSIFGENLFDDFDSWFSDPVEKRFFGKKNRCMENMQRTL